MEQLTWTLSHHIGERRARRGYHLGMPTQRTNQLFLKPQPWKSSDQIEFTQARQKVKVQVTQLPTPLPQLTRRTSQETTLHTRRLRKISTKHLTLENDHKDNVPSRVQNLRTTWPKQHLKALIQQLGHRKQVVPQRLNKSNTPQSDLVTHFDLNF
jgi:predicted component of type VI protein secretion system